MGKAKITTLSTNDRIRSCMKDNSDVRSCIDFATLWKAHPLNWSPPESAPFRKQKPKKIQKDHDNPFAVLTEAEDPPGVPIYLNQCAIKMRVALNGAGIYLDTFPKNRSEVHHVRQLNKDIRGALAAEELANWLIKAIGEPEYYEKGKALEKVKNRKGIVFFKDYWQRQINGPFDGDHIDLWNGENTPNISPWIYEQGQTSFEKSAEVWFWEIK